MIPVYHDKGVKSRIFAFFVGSNRDFREWLKMNEDVIYLECPDCGRRWRSEVVYEFPRGYVIDDDECPDCGAQGYERSHQSVMDDLADIRYADTKN